MFVSEIILKKKNWYASFIPEMAYQQDKGFYFE